MTQLTNIKQNIHQHKDKSCNLKKHKKTNSRPNRAVWTVFVNCAHRRGSTLAIYKTVQIIISSEPPDNHHNFRCCQIEGRGTVWNVRCCKLKRNTKPCFCAMFAKFTRTGPRNICLVRSLNQFKNMIQISNTPALFIVMPHYWWPPVNFR